MPIADGSFGSYFGVFAERLMAIVLEMVDTRPSTHITSNTAVWLRSHLSVLETLARYRHDVSNARRLR